MDKENIQSVIGEVIKDYYEPIKDKLVSISTDIKRYTPDISGREEMISELEHDNTDFARKLKDYFKKSDENIKIELEALSKSLRGNFQDDLSYIDNLKNDKYLNVLNIGFYGRTNSGKSTLIESLLRNQYGNLIGFGSQHFTKSIKSFAFKDNIILFDIPGISGRNQENDIESDKIEDFTQKSLSSMIDVFFFVFTIDSEQEDIVEDLKKLILTGKPVFILLNVKDGLNDEISLKRFYDRRKGNLFDTETIEQHIQRIKGLLQEKGVEISQEIHFIMPVSALAAYVGQFASRVFDNKEVLDKIENIPLKNIVQLFVSLYQPEDAKTLHELSNMGKIEGMIDEIAKKQQSIRKIISIYNKILCDIEDRRTIIPERIEVLEESKKNTTQQIELIDGKFKRFREITKSRIKSGINQAIQNFTNNNLRDIIAEHYKDKKKLESQIQEKFSEALLIALKPSLEEIKIKFESMCQELKREIEANEAIFNNFNTYSIGNINIANNGVLGKIFNDAAFFVGALGGLAMILRFAALGNFWNPVGWIANILSLTLGVLSWVWSKDKQTIISEVYTNVTKSIQEGSNEMTQKVFSHIDRLMLKPIEILFLEPQRLGDDKVDKLIKNLGDINDFMSQTSQALNKNFIHHLLMFQNIPVPKLEILNVKRKIGVITKILAPDYYNVRYDVEVLDGLLSPESVYMVNSTLEKDILLEQAIYPIIAKSIYLEGTEATVKSNIRELNLSDKQIQIYTDIAEKITNYKITIKEA